jgi:hypothetical protein
MKTSCNQIILYVGPVGPPSIIRPTLLPVSGISVKKSFEHVYGYKLDIYSLKMMYESAQQAINTLNIPAKWRKGKMESKLKKVAKWIKDEKEYAFYNIVLNISRQWTVKEPKVAYANDGDILVFADVYNDAGIVKKMEKVVDICQQNGTCAEYFMLSYPRLKFVDLYAEKDTKIRHFGYEGFYRGNIAGVKISI